MTGFESLIDDFLLDARERVQRIEAILLALAETGATPDAVTHLKAELHTLKGNSAMMGFSDLQETAHAMEDLVAAAGDADIDTDTLIEHLDRIRDRLRGLGGGTRTTSDAGHDDAVLAVGQGVGEFASVRVPFAALDRLVDLLSEMVIFRNGVEDTLHAKRGLNPHAADYPRQVKEWVFDMRSAYERLGRTLDLLQDRVLHLRVVPLRTVFGSLRRLVRDESGRAGKSVQFVAAGGDTPVDKALLDFANQSLGHLVRNAIVHGIESADERRRADKSETGTVRIEAAAQGDEIRIDVIDDGAGIDRTRLRRAAKERGIPEDDFKDEYELLFHPGFSTRDSADMSAGRGVGLSAVLDAVQRQGGDISVSSEPGVSTHFQIRLPMHVSITRAMIARAGGELYAIPMTFVVETVRLSNESSHEINRAGVIRWRDGLLPLLDLRHAFGLDAAAPGTYAIVVENGGKHRAVSVDAIVGIQEIVVKGLDPVVGSPDGVMGSTILGDGRTILILDARGLIEADPFVQEVA